MNQSEIRELFARKKGDLSQKTIAVQAGVSVSTLSRFATNVSQLDMENLIKIAAWCGVAQFSGDAIECDGNTLKNVRQVIFADTNMTAENKEKLWSVFGGMYDALAHRNEINL